MLCPHCRKDLADNQVKFCPYCGGMLPAAQVREANSGPKESYSPYEENPGPKESYSPYEENPGPKESYSPYEENPYSPYQEKEVPFLATSLGKLTAAIVAGILAIGVLLGIFLVKTLSPKSDNEETAAASSVSSVSSEEETVSSSSGKDELSSAASNSTDNAASDSAGAAVEDTGSTSVETSTTSHITIDAIPDRKKEESQDQAASSGNQTGTADQTTASGQTSGNQTGTADQAASSGQTTADQTASQATEVSIDQLSSMISGNLSQYELETVLAYGPTQGQVALSDQEAQQILNTFMTATNPSDGSPRMDLGSYGSTMTVNLDTMNRHFASFSDYQFNGYNINLVERGQYIAYTPAQISYCASAGITRACMEDENLVVYFDYHYDREGGQEVYDEQRKAVFTRQGDGSYKLLNITTV